MKHRQVQFGKIGVLNADGHAIGVDLGATAVRAAVITPGLLDGRASVTVHGLGSVPLPPGAVVSGVVSDQAAVTRAVKTLWQEMKVECHTVILGVAGQQVTVREMTLPNLPADQLARALPFQAREVVPIPLDEALLDFAPLGAPDEAAGTVSGLLLAAPRQPVVNAVQAVERAGLRVARVDLSSFALLRSIAEERLAVEAVIDIGADLTNLVIHNHGVPKVVRAVTRGGAEWTDLLVQKGGMEVAEAEQAKRLVGVTPVDPKIATMVNQAVRPLVAEIRSSIQYFGAITSGARIERVALTGASAQLPGLTELLADQLEVPVALVSPMQHIRNRWRKTNAGTESNDESAATAVSVGLAIGAAA